MEDSKASTYAMGPPWLFKGSALYQLHLVKAEVARAFIPKDFKLVEAFGYTLGGFFLAHYEDSPVSKFDEVLRVDLPLQVFTPQYTMRNLFVACTLKEHLVVIAGIVWSPPTSCAWAARVLVNNEEACRHGRKEIGLPSNVGIFSKKFTEVKEKSTNKYSSFLNKIGVAPSGRKEHTEVKISEVNESNIMSLCNISVPYVDPIRHIDDKWMGPKIRMTLPSFSGQTIHHPLLLKYACQIECRMRAVATAEVSGPTNKYDGDNSEVELQNTSTLEDKTLNRCISILLSKPVLALELNFLKMKVNAPIIVHSNPKNRVQV